MLQTIPARQLQKSYKKILDQASKSNKPIIVITNNKPIGAIISLKLLDKLESKVEKENLEAVVGEAEEEYKKGLTKSITTDEEFRAFADEVRDASQ